MLIVGDLVVWGESVKFFDSLGMDDCGDVFEGAAIGVSGYLVSGCGGEIWGLGLRAIYGANNIMRLRLLSI